MYSEKFETLNQNEIIGFSYPKLHTGKSWYVDFFILDPKTGKMRRKKYMLDGIEKISERRKRATELIESLLRLLRSGWNPFASIKVSQDYVLLDEALKKFENYVNRLPKANTRSSYCSFLNKMRLFISTYPIPPKYVYQYNTVFVTEFLDWVTDNGVSGRTRNNYRGFCSALAGFFIEREYISANPVTKVKKSVISAKKRQPLTSDMLLQLRNHLTKKSPLFLLACMMEYYTLIRPEELVNIKISDIMVKEQAVFISSLYSKNKRDAKVGLNDEIIKMMIDLKLFSFPGNYYIFGDKLKPCDKKASSEIFRRKWKILRRELKWGDEFQFYSLKDTGIRDLANAEGIVIARDQARHTDISTTNKYLQGRDMPVHNETKHFKGGL